MNLPGFPDMLLPSHQGQAEWEKTIADFNASYETLRKAILPLKKKTSKTFTEGRSNPIISCCMAWLNTIVIIWARC